MSLMPVMPHGKIEEVFPDIFFMTGTSRPTFAGVDWQYSRNMIIVRAGNELTLINTVRLDDAGLKQLDALGKVSHVVRLGQFHGIDDAFYRQLYGATQWGLAGMVGDDGAPPNRLLDASGAAPFAPVTFFSFETSALPEGLLLIEREGGVLVSCDSLQNWVEADSYFDEASAARMLAAGMIRPANIGPGWRAACTPQASDFQRLQRLSFKHLLPAHGRPIRDSAFEQFSATFTREYPG